MGEPLANREWTRHRATVDYEVMTADPKLRAADSGAICYARKSFRQPFGVHFRASK